MRSLIVSLIVIVTCYSSELVEEVRKSFTFNGSPIHPGIVELFTNWDSDAVDPQVLAVDLTTAQNSNRFYKDSCKKSDNGWMETIHDNADDRSSFSYKFIGALPSGTLVLHTCQSGGGSGSLESVMLLAIKSEAAISADGGPHTQHVLRILRSVGIGDRANGAIVIDGSKVHVRRPKAHNVEQRGDMVLDDPQRAPTAQSPGK